jgi:hypothetical protein
MHNAPTGTVTPFFMNLRPGSPAASPVHRGSGEGRAGHAEHAEGLREAWQHMKHDVEEPSEWDRGTEEEFKHMHDARRLLGLR